MTATQEPRPGYLAHIAADPRADVIWLAGLPAVAVCSLRDVVVDNIADAETHGDWPEDAVAVERSLLALLDAEIAAR